MSPIFQPTPSTQVEENEEFTGTSGKEKANHGPILARRGPLVPHESDPRGGYPISCRISTSEGYGENRPTVVHPHRIPPHLLESTLAGPQGLPTGSNQILSIDPVPELPTTHAQVGGSFPLQPGPLWTSRENVAY